MITILLCEYNICMILKENFLNILRIYFFHFFYPLEALIRSERCFEPKNDNRIHTPKTFYNKNSNTEANRILLNDHSSYLFMDLYRFNRLDAFYDFFEKRSRELLMKFQFLHEEPNYYSLVWQTDTSCFTGKRRISSIIHRV